MILQVLGWFQMCFQLCMVTSNIHKKEDLADDPCDVFWLTESFMAHWRSVNKINFSSEKIGSEEGKGIWVYMHDHKDILKFCCKKQAFLNLCWALGWWFLMQSNCSKSSNSKELDCSILLEISWGFLYSTEIQKHCTNFSNVDFFAEKGCW